MMAAMMVVEEDGGDVGDTGSVVMAVRGGVVSPGPMVGDGKVTDGGDSGGTAAEGVAVGGAVLTTGRTEDTGMLLSSVGAVLVGAGWREEEVSRDGVSGWLDGRPVDTGIGVLEISSGDGAMLLGVREREGAREKGASSCEVSGRSTVPEGLGDGVRGKAWVGVEALGWTGDEGRGAIDDKEGRSGGREGNWVERKGGIAELVVEMELSGRIGRSPDPLPGTVKRIIISQ